MAGTDLWKYCTQDQCRDMLLSFRLLGDNDWTDEKVMACLYALSNHAELHYRKARIPKRNGGYRTILAPDELLRFVQKNLLRHVLEGYELPPAEAAYRKGASPAAAAAPHVGKRVVMKLDVEDFFGSITFPMVLAHAFPPQIFPPAVGTLLTSLCCYRDYLPQGAPTSPAVSNLVMRPFDRYVTEWCGERGIAYSRYCDDMTFSGDFDTEPVRRKVYAFLREMGFSPNREKTRVITRGACQTVTGLVVNEKVQTPAAYRRKLRQEIYYCRKFGTGERPYLLSLLGKVRYVLATRPDDAWFLEAEQWLRRQTDATGV